MGVKRTGGNTYLVNPFPDHDCRRVKNPLLDWNLLRATFKTRCPGTKYTHSLHCSTVIDNWTDGLAFLEDTASELFCGIKDVKQGEVLCGCAGGGGVVLSRAEERGYVVERRE